MQDSREADHMDQDLIEILLVEDDENDIELTLRALRGENLANKIQIARDGVEALSYLATAERQMEDGTGRLPKLILLDLKLPLINGLQVLEQVKSNYKTKFIPVVVMTSSKEDVDLTTCYRLGANSYIQKPLTFEQFRENVKQLGMYWLLVNQLPSLSALRAEREGE